MLLVLLLELSNHACLSCVNCEFSFYMMLYVLCFFFLRFSPCFVAFFCWTSFRILKRYKFVARGLFASYYLIVCENVPIKSYKAEWSIQLVPDIVWSPCDRCWSVWSYFIVGSLDRAYLVSISIPCNTYTNINKIALKCVSWRPIPSSILWLYSFPNSCILRFF